MNKYEKKWKRNDEKKKQEKEKQKETVWKMTNEKGWKKGLSYWKKIIDIILICLLWNFSFLPSSHFIL